MASSFFKWGNPSLSGTKETQDASKRETRFGGFSADPFFFLFSPFFFLSFSEPDFRCGFCWRHWQRRGIPSIPNHPRNPLAPRNTATSAPSPGTAGPTRDPDSEGQKESHDYLGTRENPGEKVCDLDTGKRARRPTSPGQVVAPSPLRSSSFF